MGISQKVTEFAGLPVVEYEQKFGLLLSPTGDALRGALLDALRADPDDTASRNALLDYMSERDEGLFPAAYRVENGRWDEDIPKALESLLADPALCLLPALVIGNWGNSPAETIIKELIEARERLLSLRALFFGDIVCEESEISWIEVADLTDLLLAFPNLKTFRSRGYLKLRPFRHERLKSLAIEASNLSRTVVQAVGESDLPALEHLELWLGTDAYDADTEPDGLAPILSGKRLPSLTHLGLRNSERADEFARALDGAPLLERLRSLDLSLGNLSDRGAEALLDNPAIAKLERLDIHHHYVFSATVARLRGLGIEVDAREPQRAAEDDRYCAHSE